MTDTAKNTVIPETITVNCRPLNVEECVEEIKKAKQIVMYLRGKALEFRNFKLLADCTEAEREFLKTRPDLLHSINSVKSNLDVQKRITTLQLIKLSLPNVKRRKHREMMEMYLKGGTMEEAGQVYGLSRQRVHQIIKRYTK